MRVAQLTTRELSDRDRVPVVSKTNEYGVAEFICCLQYKWGKLKRVFMTPCQQPDAEHKFEIDASYGALDFHLGAYTHKGLDEPRAWLYFWCPEHKAASFRAYVPIGATNFIVQTGSSLSVTFDADL